MHEWQGLSHVRWECKYHVVIIPKYRRKVLDEQRIRQYIREQEKLESRQGELDLK